MEAFNINKHFQQFSSSPQLKSFLPCSQVWWSDLTPSMKCKKTLKTDSKTCGIKSVSWEYSCDGEYLEEFNKGKILKDSFLLAVLSWNRLDLSLLCWGLATSPFQPYYRLPLAFSDFRAHASFSILYPIEWEFWKKKYF